MNFFQFFHYICTVLKIQVVSIQTLLSVKLYVLLLFCFLSLVKAQHCNLCSRICTAITLCSFSRVCYCT